MNHLDQMLKRNKELATPMPSLPQSLRTVKAVIIGCADIRVDPVHVLGIEPGEAPNPIFDSGTPERAPAQVLESFQNKYEPIGTAREKEAMRYAAIQHAGQ